jgi:hypothetical protein
MSRPKWIFNKPRGFKLEPFQHPPAFVPHVYYIYNASIGCWLGCKDQWTPNFLDALGCPTYDFACEMFDGPLPNGFNYLSCEIFAVQHVWFGPPKDLRGI